MEYETTVSVAAPAAAVWAVLADLRSWPRWTPTVERVETGAASPDVGLQVRVKQPGRRAVTYTVDVVEPGGRFRWRNDAVGVHQVADHVIVPDGGQACTVRLSFAMTGPLGGLLGRLGATKIREFVDTEASALQTRAESRDTAV